MYLYKNKTNTYFTILYLLSMNLFSSSPPPYLKILRTPLAPMIFSRKCVFTWNERNIIKNRITVKLLIMECTGHNTVPKPILWLGGGAKYFSIPKTFLSPPHNNTITYSYNVIRIKGGHIAHHSEVRHWHNIIRKQLH